MLTERSIWPWSHEPLSSGSWGRWRSLISSVDSQSCVLGVLSARVSTRLGLFTTPSTPSEYIYESIFLSFLMILGNLGQSGFHCALIMTWKPQECWHLYEQPGGEGKLYIYHNALIKQLSRHDHLEEKLTHHKSLWVYRIPIDVSDLHVSLNICPSQSECSQWLHRKFWILGVLDTKHW